jgi:RecB family exonuclease
MNKINRLSASSIKKYKNCPKSFFYKEISDVEPPDEEEPDFFAVGNTVHDTLESVLQEDDVLELSEDELLSRLRDEERSLDYNYEDSEKVQTCLEFASKYISGYVTDIVSVEDRFEMNVKGIDFVGYADLIADINDRGEDLNDVIIDWKTGKENDEWKERIQGGMYVKMFHEIYGRWPESIQFIYLNEGTRSVHNRIDDGDVMWNDHQNKYWEEIEGDISDISNSAFNDEWEANVSDSCYFCDYKFACSDYIGSEDCEPHHLEIEPNL